MGLGAGCTDRDRRSPRTRQSARRTRRDREPGKWVKVLGWGDAAAAKRMITDAIERAKK